MPGVDRTQRSSRSGRLTHSNSTRGSWTPPPLTSSMSAKKVDPSPNSSVQMVETAATTLRINGHPPPVFRRMKTSNRADCLTLYVELPGVASDQIEMEVESATRLIHITATMSEVILQESAEPTSATRFVLGGELPEVQSPGGVSLKENLSMTFKRSIFLPTEADMNQIFAKLEDGILRVDVYKHPVGQGPKRKIDITVVSTSYDC